METVEITFNELRIISASVIDFIEKNYWWENYRGFEVKIEDDLGITGDKAAELMSKFSDRFKVDLSSFQFDKHFNPEPTCYNLFLLVFACLMLIAILLKVIITEIVFLFDERKSRLIWEYSLLKTWNRWDMINYGESNPSKMTYLTIGDSITSAVKGEFTQRENIHFQLRR